MFFPVILFTGCNHTHNQSDYKRLETLDTLLQTSPKSVADSLSKINPKRLSMYNYGYYLLLDVISKDKTYYDFRSDSSIVLSSKLLASNKNDYPINYSRSLMYQGIVRYRMGITDSTAYEPIKKGIDFLEKKKIDNPMLLFLCYEYLGLIHQENNNMDYSEAYLKKAITNAKRCEKRRYLFDSYVQITWLYMQMKKFNAAKQYIDTLNNFNNVSILQRASIDHILSIYYEHNREYNKALIVNKKLLLSNKNYEDISKMFYRISQDYKELNILDSALFYATKAEECKTDSDNYLNYFYYSGIGEISERLQQWQKSAEAYKEAYILRNKAMNKDLDTRILELEKKYDLTDAENRALHYRNRVNTIGLLGILLALLFVSITIILRQKGRQTTMKIQLAEHKNKLLEQNKREIEHKLMEKEFILPLYQQISQRNAMVKSLLSDLKTNTYLCKKPQLIEIINSVYQDFISTSNINKTEESSLSPEKFKNLTGISFEHSKLLNDSEKMLLIFITMELDNKQIAVLFNTSESSIRGRKTKLRIKLETHKIDLEGINI